MSKEPKFTPDSVNPEDQETYALVGYVGPFVLIALCLAGVLVYDLCQNPVWTKAQHQAQSLSQILRFKK